MLFLLYGKRIKDRANSMKEEDAFLYLMSVFMFDVMITLGSCAATAVLVFLAILAGKALVS